MNDFIAGPASGADDDDAGAWGFGAPPPVLLAALGAAVLIAITFLAFVIGGGGGDSGNQPVPAGGVGPDDPGQGTTASAERRALLTVSIEGGGSGKVRISPRDRSCAETCEAEFVTGTRVSLTADAADGSRFEGWQDACTGTETCSFVIDRERAVTATFEGTPTSQCEDGRDNDDDTFTDERDPGCRNDDTEAPDNTPEPASDCTDATDNDGDGLVDTAQDPGCSDGTEADADTPPPTTTSPVTPPPAVVDECSDGRDNDGDGLVDQAQDPNCATGTSEGAGSGATTGVSQCRDGRDNDGDGKVDRPADPGCDADGSEAGG